MNWFQSQSVVLQAFLAGLFTWGCTIVGSAIVFFFKHISRKLLDIMMGFAAGVMIEASFWSLLQPSIEYAENSYGSLAWVASGRWFSNWRILPPLDRRHRPSPSYDEGD